MAVNLEDDPDFREDVEGALRESEGRYRDLVEGSIQGVLIHVDGKAVYANQAYADIFGYDSPDELLAQDSARDHIAPHDRERMRQLTEARLRGEDIPAYEFEGIRKDGSRIWVENIGRAITWKGKPAVQRTVVDVTQRKKAEERLKAERERYRDLVEGSIQGVLIHVDGKAVFANQAYADIFGYDSPDELLAQDSARDHIAPHDRERMRLLTQRRLRGEDIPAYEFEGIRKDGSRIWLENIGRAITWEGKPAIQRTVVDITQRKKAEERLKEAEERTRLILESVGEGIYGLDRDGRTSFVNRAAAKMLGYEQVELIGKPMHTLVHHSYPDGTTYPREKCPMYATFTDGKTRIITDEVLWRRDGSSFPVEYTSAPARKDGELVGAVVVFRDITERKIAEDELHRLAATDPLTGLSNRRHFMESAAAETARARRYDNPLSVLIADVDHFKEINDGFGHAKGDEVLLKIADLCRESMRASDVFARYGGEEFAAILPMTSLEHAELLANRLRRQIEVLEIPSDDGPISVTVSFGVAQFSPKDGNVDTTLNRADKALYAAKAAGRNRVMTAGDD